MRVNTYFASLALASVIPAAMVQAAPSAGDREITIQGMGTSDKEFDNNAFSAVGSIGWFITDRSE